MNSKLIVLTTEDESRESGNVYYATYLLISSTTLKFKEKIFTKKTTGDDTFISEVQALGYTVETLDPEYVLVEPDDEDEDEDTVWAPLYDEEDLL